MSDTKWLTPQEVAKSYGVTVRNVRSAMEFDQVRWIKVGGRYRIDADSVEALIQGPKPVVGEVGDTGNSTGPHIRFELDGQGEPAHD